MASYEHEFSNFPDEKITLHNFVNVDDSTVELVTKIDNLRQSGDYEAAQKFIDENADVLKQCIADAVTFRTWEEEIYNTQIYAKRIQQSIYFSDNAPDCEEDDVWLGGDIGVV